MSLGHRPRTTFVAGGVALLAVHLVGAAAVLAVSWRIGMGLLLVLVGALALHVGIHGARRRTLENHSTPVPSRGPDAQPAGRESSST
jgi:hypothetical protein